MGVDLVQARAALAEWEAWIASVGRDAVEPALLYAVDCLHRAFVRLDAVEGPIGRLCDLVRHQRGPLFDAGLINEKEYAELAEDHGAVARLEGYDQMRARIAELEFYGGAAEIHCLTVDRDEARAMLGECFRLSGADTDGNGWPHLWRKAVGEVWRMLEEHEELKAEHDRLLVQFTGDTAAGWEAEGIAHTAWMAEENRGGGIVSCPDCGGVRFVDGAAGSDLSPRQCMACRYRARSQQRLLT